MFKASFFCSLKRILSSFLVCVLVCGQNPGYARSLFVSSLPEPGAMVLPSTSFVPVLAKGLVLHPDNPLAFDFIVDSGYDTTDQELVRQQSERMAQYFLAAVTVPEDQLWVNLSPYEQDRIIENDLGRTVLGRDMLAQDYILKQLTASLISPENDPGKTLWARIYAQAQAEFGTTDIPFDVLNKVWIVPDKAEVSETDTAVYVSEASLKVMLDQDYSPVDKSGEDRLFSGHGGLSRDLAKDMMRSVILPAIEKEVNEGQQFAVMRQIYHAAILAKWYKERIRNSLMASVYVGQNRVAGVLTDELGLKDEIYERYVAAFKVGAFDKIREEPDALSGEPILRQYFSGGEQLDRIVLSYKDFSGMTVSGELFRIAFAMQVDDNKADPVTALDHSFVNTRKILDILIRALQEGDEIYDPLGYERKGASADGFGRLKHLAWVYWQEIRQIRELLRVDNTGREIVVADLGTARGHFILAAAQALTRAELDRVIFIGVDSDNRNRQYAEEEALRVSGLRVRWVTADMFSDNFTEILSDYNPDLIVSNHVLQYLPGDPAGYLSEWARVCKGSLMVSVPFNELAAETRNRFDLPRVEAIGIAVELDESAGVWLDSFEDYKYGGLWLFQKESRIEYSSSRQATLAKEMIFIGTALHSGKAVTMRILPAEADTGFVFESRGHVVPVKIGNVHETIKATRLSNSRGGDVMTPEHILSALGSVGVNNARIDLGDSEEPPIFDGSARVFIQQLSEPGVVRRLPAQRKAFTVKRPVVFFRESEGVKVLVLPTAERHLRLSYFIEFRNPAIGAQFQSIILDKRTYQEQIAPSRTFIESKGLSDLFQMQRYLGIGDGAGAVLLDEAGGATGTGFQVSDEAVRHKILDLFGDLQIAGFAVYGHVIAIEAGHRDHNELVQRLVAAESSGEYEEYDGIHRQALLDKFRRLLESGNIPQSLFDEVLFHLADPSRDLPVKSADYGGIALKDIRVQTRNRARQMWSGDQKVGRVIQNGLGGFRPVILQIAPVRSPLSVMAL